MVLFGKELEELGGGLFGFRLQQLQPGGRPVTTPWSLARACVRPLCAGGLAVRVRGNAGEPDMEMVRMVRYVADYARWVAGPAGILKPGRELLAGRALGCGLGVEVRLQAVVYKGELHLATG